MSEISCRITSSFLHYVNHSRPDLIPPLLKDLPYDEEYLMNTDNWISWEDERLLEDRLAKLFNDEKIMFKIGQSVLNHKSLGILNLLVKFFLTPERLIRHTPKIARYFTKDLVHVSVLEVSHESATIEFRIKGKQTRGACLYNQGMLSVCTELFGMDAASISELQCVVPIHRIGQSNGKIYSIDNRRRVRESDSPEGNGKIIGLTSENGEFQINKTIFGAESCIYRISWKNNKSNSVKRTAGKEEAFDEALHHLEVNHKKLETAYERLWHSEAKYRSLMENASDIICFLDSEGMITSINRKGLELSGYSSNEIVGKNFLAYVDGPYKKIALLKFRKAFRNSSTPFELNIRKKDSGFIVISANSSPIRELGHTVGLMVIARDITKDREMTARLLEAERFAAKGIVAAEIAHEINNSLANMETALFIVNNIRTDNQYRVDIFHDVFDEIERMSGIVKGILEVYRSDNAVIQPVDINTEISKVLNITKRRLYGKVISIASDLSPELPAVPCYPGHIKQVLLNLIKNAEEAMISSSRKVITIRTAIDNGHVRLDVEDTGCGVPQEYEEKVFSQLYTSKTEGSGMGLAICREIVSRYQGNIVLKSSKGNGTTVTVSLPTNYNA